MQGTFKQLTVIIGVEGTDEREFIETLCKFSGDTLSLEAPPSRAVAITLRLVQVTTIYTGTRVAPIN